MGLRRSPSAFSLITRERGAKTEWLLQWNSGWKHLNFIGGHQEEGESFHACAVRETCEELDVGPQHLRVSPDACGHFRYVDWSMRHEQLTEFTFELFQTELSRSTEIASRIDANPDNAWVTLHEILSGVAKDGRPISPTVQRLLTDFGWLPPGPRTEFMVAVTGHRDIAELDGFLLRNRVEAAFDDLTEQASGRKICLLSPLAAGADQYVARCALERGWELRAPFPLPIADYESDFSTIELQEFRRLRDAASCWFTIAPPANRPADSERSRFYWNVGSYVVHRSEALIALWDGAPLRRTGGTADILHHAIQTAQTLRPIYIAWVRVKRI